MILVIDNYDSFTYNVVQYLGELGAELRVVRNDEKSLDELDAMRPQRLVVSPGPCTPNEAGVSVAAIQHFAGDIPVLGICLGHQAIGQAFGGRVVRAKQVMHGKTSPLYHADVGVFSGLPQGYQVTRYHSLVLERESLPECLAVTAWTLDEDGNMDEIMGVRHRELAVEGVQFHPESIMTRHGHDILQRFLAEPAGSRPEE